MPSLKLAEHLNCFKSEPDIQNHRLSMWRLKVDRIAAGIFTTFILVHLAILPYFCRDLPFSAYYQPKMPEQQKGELDGNLLHVQDIHPGHTNHKHKESDLAVLVVTSYREYSYLNKTVTTLIRELAVSEEKHPVFVCSAETGNVEMESMAGIPGMNVEMQSMAGISGVNVVLPCIHKDCQGSARNLGVINDFVICHREVEEHLGRNIKYLLCLQDDVLLMKSFFHTLSSILVHHSDTLMKHPWLDIKLYLTPRLRGYAWDVLPLSELLASTTLLTLFFELLIYPIQSKRSESAILRRCLLFVLVLMTLLSISRQHLAQWRRLHPQLYAWRHTPTCGAQAVVYNRTNLGLAVDHLQASSQTEGLDFLVSRFRESEGLRGYLLEPNLVAHSGKGMLVIGGSFWSSIPFNWCHNYLQYPL